MEFDIFENLLVFEGCVGLLRELEKKKKSRSIWRWFDVWIICLALQNIVMLLCTCFISLVGSSRAWTMGLCQTYYDTTDCYSLSKPRGKSFTGTDCAWCCLFLNAGKRAGTEQLQSPGDAQIPANTFHLCPFPPPPFIMSIIFLSICLCYFIYIDGCILLKLSSHSIISCYTSLTL